MTFAIVFSVLLAAGAVALAVSVGNGGKQLAAAQLAMRGDVATTPVDGAGNAISLNQTAAQAAASLNCTLTVPANPLSAQGLATPWQLGDGCAESNTNLQAFVEATILSPAGALQVYNPLVITQGTQPAAAPVVPTIAAGSQVIINVGFNGTNLVLAGRGARQGRCIDALGQSVIGQVSACNAAAFFQMANAEIAQGTLKVPASGTGKDGQACPTTRSFTMIDQDQSDNVNTTYLLNANGQTAQNTTANAQALAAATPIVNGSDNALLTKFMAGALGCTPFSAPSVTTAGGMADSQSLDELSAAANQQDPVALVPPNDEMVLVNGQFSLAKTNVYRSLVGQAPLPAGTNLNQTAATYCQDMVNGQPARSAMDMTLEAAVGSPVPAVGNNLATFLGNRLSMSFTNLACQNYGLKNPVTVTADGNGAATAVTYNTAQQTATLTPTPTASATPTACATTTATATPAAPATPTATATAPAPATTPSPVTSTGVAPAPAGAAPGGAAAAPAGAGLATVPTGSGPTTTATPTTAATPTGAAAPAPCVTPAAGGTGSTPSASASPSPSPTVPLNRRHRGRHHQDPSGE